MKLDEVTTVIKVSVISDEITQEFERALDIALAHNVRHVELRGLWGTNVAQLTDEQIERAKRALDERDMGVVAIAAPVFKVNLSDERKGNVGDTFKARADGSVAEQLEVFDRCASVADAFGTDLVRTFAFWRDGAPNEDVYNEIEERLRLALERAENHGVRLALENEHACFIGTASEAIEALKRIPSPSFGLIWDPGNAACLDPIEQVFPKGYEAIKAEVGFERIFHVHVKDPAHTDEGTKFIEFGKGELDYHGQIKALVADGYQGAVSMETHWKGDGISKEESTAACLDALWRIIDECGLRDTFE